MLIDTHVHTSFSDGLYGPAHVVSEARSRGIGLLSITDHDCVDAYPEAVRLADSVGIRVVPGVEMTTKYEEGFSCVHIVGLGIDINSDVRRVLRRVADARDDSDRRFLESLNRHFEAKYPGWEPTTSIKPGVFQSMMANARRQGIMISEKELMGVFMKPELWVPIEYEVTLEEAVSYIKEWGGVPVLAHPFDFGNDAGLLLKKFIAAGGEAVELCKYRYKVRDERLGGLSMRGRLDKEREMNEWTASQARRHGLRLTMASDYHGQEEMGMDPAEYGIDASWLYSL
jgi:predicted metal-dependent phosphoesterase TrpH